MPKNSPRKPLDSRLKQILQEMDPSWSGETPELAKPISLSPGGLERLRAALSPAPDPEAAYGRMANAALRLFYLISRKWGLTEEDQNAILGAEENPSLEALGKKGWGSFDLEALEFSVRGGSFIALLNEFICVNSGKELICLIRKHVHSRLLKDVLDADREFHVGLFRDVGPVWKHP